MSVATVTKPVITIKCECCNRTTAILERTMPDGEKFKLCQSCTVPVEGSTLTFITR